jgi:hypothetical protein
LKIRNQKNVRLGVKNGKLKSRTNKKRAANRTRLINEKSFGFCWCFPVPVNFKALPFFNLTTKLKNYCMKI